MQMAKFLRKFKIVCTVQILLLFSGVNANAKDGTSLWGTVGTWIVKADWTLGGGCFIVNEYETGAALRIGLDPSQNNGYILIVDNDWTSIEAGKSYKIRVEVGDEAPWEGDAIGWQSSNGVPGLWISYEKIKFLLEIVK
ncbi:MAG: hypothetical protein PVF65_11525, partial [Sphingomonadales bacterium]